MTSAEKAAAFRQLLAQGWTNLLLDARRPGVSVPPILAKEPMLILQYGLDLPIPVRDLSIDDNGVGATLSFNRTPMITFVPWSAVYGIRLDGPELFWHVVDAEVIDAVTRESAPGKPYSFAETVVSVERPRLTSVPANADDGDEERTGPHGVPVLRVVR